MENNRERYDLAIAIDCGDASQLGRIFHQVFKKSDKTMVIDHHIFRKPFGDVQLIDRRASAVGEIVFDLRHFKGREEDIDAAADEIRTIKGVKAVVLFRELNTKTLRVSLRSKERINVGKVAKLFNGGGHYDVAGCYISNTKKAKDRLLKEVEKVVKGS